jgi:tetratricopeptide (TPR) repeat protein
MKNRFNTLLSVGVGTLLAACGGGGAARPAGPVTNPARATGGEVIRTQGTGQAVSATANQRFEEAARLMRQHDEANNGRGDWNPATCNEVAARFEAAANEQPGGAFPEAWFNRGLAFERCGMTDQARQALQRAIDVSRGHNYCRARVQLGVYQYRARQIAEATATFEQAIREDPNCVEGYTNLAMILRERGQGNDRVQAVANIRQALARDDRFIPALNQLALTYLAEAGDDPRSQRLMLAGIVCLQAVQVTQQRGTEMTPEVRGFVADVYNTWGLIDIRSGQIIRALDHFRRAYQLNPNMFEAWVNYGTINLSFRGYQDAREAFQHAVELRPNDYDAHIGLGVALRGLGQPQQAEQEYNRAREIDQNRPDAYYNLGVLHEGYMGGDIEDLEHANQFLEQFVAKAGGAPRYADAVERARAHIRNNTQAIQALRAVQQLNQQNAVQQGGAAGGAAPANGGAAAPAGGATPPAGGSAPAGGAAPPGGAAAPAPAAGSAVPSR